MPHSTSAASGGSVTSADGHDASAKPGSGALASAAIGVVYGDIGTSPLYAFREAVIGGDAVGNRRK